MNIKLKFNLNKLMSFIFVFMAISPYFNRRFQYIIPVLTIWFVTTIFSGKQGKLKFTKPSLICIGLIFFWCGYELLLWILGISIAGIGTYAVHICFWVSIIIFLYYYNNRDYRHLYHLSNFALFSLVISTIENIRINYVYPNLKNQITLLDALGEKFNLSIAFTSFAYAIAMIMIFLVYQLFTIRKLRYVIYLGLLAILFIQMGRAIPLFGILFGLLYLYYIYSFYGKDKKENLLKLGIFLIVGIIGTIFLLWIYIEPYVVYSIIPSESVAEKIYRFLTSDAGSGHHRIELALLSFGTFIESWKNFFLGIGFHVVQIINQDFSPAYEIGIGSHSGIFDTLGYYGIFGFSIIVLILKSFYTEISKKLSDINKELWRMTILLFVILNIFSSVYAVDCGIIFFIYIPGFLLYQQVYNNRKLIKEVVYER